MIHSILIIGQSNMAGRGFVHEVEPICNEKIKILRNGRWRPMYVPINADRETSGINLAESFADQYAREKDVEVGIIPCADGGTCLDQWRVGGLLFDHACYLAELASRTSTITGVLWHQGEGDCREERYPYYEEKLLVIIDGFRRKLKLYDVPFLLGGLGDYLKNCNSFEYLKNYHYVNDALKNVASRYEMTGFVSAEGLSANPDNIHFNAQSLREFGLRYYKEFCKLERQDQIFTKKSVQDDVPGTGLEDL